MRKINSTLVRAALVFAAYSLGVAGYLPLYGGDVPQAMYSAVRIFTINVDAAYGNLNWMIRVARWMGVCLTASFVYSMGKVVYVWLNGRLRAARRDAVVLSGDARYLEGLQKDLGRRAILSNGDVRAHTHVLAFESDDALLAFMGEHAKTLQSSKRVYACALGLPPSGLKHDGLIVRNVAEMCARVYWREHFLARGEREVVLIGLDAYGSALLVQGLLVNVFQRNDTVCYHVFGNSTHFLNMHDKLSSVAAINAREPGRDTIFFHDEPWHAHADMLARADRVILAHDKDAETFAALCDLVRLYPRGKAHARISNGSVLRALFAENGWEITPFGTAQTLFCAENIMLDKLTLSGRRIDARYMRNNVCAECWREDCLTCQKNIDSWNNMDSFTQNSNLAQADHMPVKLRILLGDDTREPFGEAAARAKEAYMRAKGEKDYSDELNAIEHERWMRYHYLAGWAYADIPKKDKARRLHPCLLPYDSLSDADKAKDADAWDALFEQYP